MRVLSYSQISTYEQCPLRYRLHYVDGLPEPPRSYFSFGTSVHAAVEFFFASPLMPPSRSEVLAELDRVWRSEGYASPEEERLHRLEARTIVNRFWFTHAPTYRPVIATEEPFEIDLGGVSLRGIIDRVDPLHDGSALGLVDYKTGRYQWHQAEVDANLQLTLYQLAAERVWQRPVGRLTLYHLRSNRPFPSAPRSRETLRRAQELVFATAEAIDRQAFAPRLGRYCPCEFARYCPLFGGETPPLPVCPPDSDEIPAPQDGVRSSQGMPVERR